MAYQSFFGSSGGSTSTPAKSGGYTSFFGTPTIAQPSPDELAQQRQQQQQTSQQPTSTPAAKPKSFMNKLVGGVKGFASAATTGEQKLAQGVARVLPGGTNDIKATEQSATADQQAGKTYAKLFQQGKISKDQYQKATGQVAQQSNKTTSDYAKTEKAMPTKAQIALGAGSTAADVLTAGALPELKVATAGSKARLAANVGTRLAANATAGGLNAAAGGGDKKQVIGNTIAGAALPEALGIAGKAGAKGVNKAVDVVSSKPAKELVTNVKTQNALEKLASEQQAKQAKTAVADLPTIDTSHLEPKPAVAAAPATRPPEQIKSDIKANADHVKTLTGKAPESHFNTDATGKQTIAKDVPADVKPYLKTHQELQKEYIGATSPEKTIAEYGGLRPQHELQTQFEAAYNKGDMKTAQSIVDQMPDPTLKGPLQNLIDRHPTKASDVPTTPTAESSKVEAPASTKLGEQSVPQSTTKTSGSALNAEARAVQKGIKAEFKDKANYDAGSYKQEAQNAVDLLKNNPDEARAIAFGDKPGNNAIHEVAVAKAVENKALRERDAQTLIKLSQSSRHTVTSEAAQRLGAEGYDTSGSVVKQLAIIRKARQDAAEQRLGKPMSKAVSDEVKQIRAAKPKVTRQTWGEFIESIKC